ncbi:MAG TPA: DMT family transporter, partial [Burkholderiales bacterium]|nr:DMT family transporter [Burkholderiales bacterium]
SGLALLLILAAAGVHATWNYLLKRSGGGTAFVWLFATLSALIYAPLAAAVVWWTAPALTPASYGLMLASAVVHTAYYMLLDRGYRSGDLSLVYPIARGSAPLITVLVAVMFLNENPSGLAMVGAVLIGVGAVAVMGDLRQLRASGSASAVGFALLTGCMIASYTVIDKLAVAAFLVPPLLHDWATNLGRVFIMAPLALRQRAALRSVWRQRRFEIIGVAILCPLSYIMVLSAMVFTPVSYVAPAREISILFAALIGAQLLAEGQTGRRLCGAAAMVGGIVCLAVG